jgi:hypothetical protein
LTAAQQELLKKNTVQRQGEIAILQRQEAILQKQQKQLGGGGGGGGGDHRNIPHVSSGPVDADADDYEQAHGDNSEHGPDDGDHHHRQSTTRQIDQDGFYVDHDDPNDNDVADEEDEEDDDDIDELDVMAAIRKRQKTIRKEMLAEGGHRGTIHAVRWADSRLAKEMAVRERTLNNQNYNNNNNKNAPTNNTVRDSADAMQEIQAREEERAKILGKDPLGVYHSITEIAPTANIPVTANIASGMNNNNNEEYFDLRYFEARQGEQIEMALQEIQEDIMKAEAMVAQSGHNAAAAEEILKKHILQKQSLEQLIESLGGLERIENIVTTNGTATTSFTNLNMLANTNSNRPSLLPTRPTFHPLLFLTILHRKTQYKDLLESMERLSSKFLS